MPDLVLKKRVNNTDSSEIKKKTAVQTYCRIRPRFEGWENKVSLRYTKETVMNSAKKNTSKLAVRTTRFFKEVFGPKASNLDLFNSMVIPMLENVMKGFPSVLIAYGQTGSGKTYSMLGIGNDQHPGLLQYSLKWLLNNSESGSIQLTAVEVYGIHSTRCDFFDLLQQPEDWASKVPLRALHMATDVTINTPQECSDFILNAHKASHFAPTAKNPQSSRGHIAFICRVQSKGRQSAFVVVDLAGSEGMDALESAELKKQTMSYETRKMEAGIIKNGLGELRGMINELKRRRLQKAKGTGLRQLLFEHVTGNTILSFLFTVAPSQQHADPTENTLRVADSASQIKKQVMRLNKTGPSAKDIIENLRKDLSEKDRLLKESRQKTSDALAKVRSMEVEGDDLREQLSGQDSLKDTVRKLENEKKSWQGREMAMMAVSRKMRRTIADLNTKIQVLMVKDHAVTPGGPPVGGGAAPIEDLKSQNDELREDLQQMIQRVLNLNEQIEGQKTEIEKQRQKSKETQRSLKSELAKLKSENELLKVTFAEKEKELEVKNTRIGELVGQLDVSKEDSVDFEPSSKWSEIDFPTISLHRCKTINASVEEAIQSSEKVAAKFLKTSWNKLCGSDRRYRQAVRELFHKIDTEKDGLIDLCEFTTAVYKFGLSDQEAINNVFNKVCSRTLQQQKVMELGDLENLIFVEGNKYVDQPLELIFEKAVKAKVNQPLLNFEDDLIGDWMEWKSTNDRRFFRVDWSTVWVEADRRKREIRVWRDNAKRELTRRIKLDSTNTLVYSGSRENSRKGIAKEEDKMQFYVVSKGMFFDSVYNFRTNSSVAMHEWATYILHITKGIDNVDVKTEVMLVLGCRKNIASERTLRFKTQNPLASEALMKLKRLFDSERDIPSKFGLPRQVEEINLLSGGKVLEPIDVLKDGDVLYALRKETVRTKSSAPYGNTPGGPSELFVKREPVNRRRSHRR